MSALCCACSHWKLALLRSLPGWDCQPIFPFNAVVKLCTSRKAIQRGLGHCRRAWARSSSGFCLGSAAGKSLNRTVASALTAQLDINSELVSA